MMFRKHGIQVEMNDYPTLLMVPSYWKNVEIEEAIKLLFEKLNVPGLYLIDQSLATVFGCGFVTGLVVDIGHTFTTVVAVIESAVITSSKCVIELGGKDIAKKGLKVLDA
jgi:actin-related protein